MFLIELRPNPGFVLRLYFSADSYVKIYNKVRPDLVMYLFIFLNQRCILKTYIFISHLFIYLFTFYIFHFFLTMNIAVDGMALNYKQTKQ